jgi:hypothetical protein
MGNPLGHLSYIADTVLAMDADGNVLKVIKKNKVGPSPDHPQIREVLGPNRA